MRIALFLLLFAVQSPLHAAIQLGTSLEWITDTAQAIGVYSVVPLRDAPQSPGRDTVSLPLKLELILKGSPPATAESLFWGDQSRHIESASGGQFLAFLSLDEQQIPRLVHLTSLTFARERAFYRDAINAKFEVLINGEQILRTVRDRLASHPSARAMSLEEMRSHWRMGGFGVVVPSGTPADDALFSKSVNFLLVPDDLKAKEVKPRKLPAIAAAGGSLHRSRVGLLLAMRTQTPH